MAFNAYDQPHSEFGEYKKINDYYKVEVSLVRMDNDYYLKKDDKGEIK